MNPNAPTHREVRHGGVEFFLGLEPAPGVEPEVLGDAEHGGDGGSFVGAAQREGGPEHFGQSRLERKLREDLSIIRDGRRKETKKR